MSHIDDKRELLKLKQGLVTEDESVLEVDEKPHIIKPTGKAAWSNFVYHHSLQLKFGVFFLIIAAIFVYFALTDEKADITILLIADTPEVSVFFALRAEELELEIELFTPDFDGNGKVHVQCLFIDLVTHVGEIARNPEAVQGNRIKLFGEVRAENALIYIGNREALENIPLGAEMPVEDFYLAFYNVKDTSLELDSPEDLYIAVRRSGKESELSKALTVLENITGNYGVY
jgi:hypothetical protein